MVGRKNVILNPVKAFTSALFAQAKGADVFFTRQL
jgi:hypothetical protein